MPDTAEHRADMHRLATARREAGRPIWDATLNLVDVFRNDGMTLLRKRDEIVTRIKRLALYKAAAETVEHPDRDGYYDAEDLVNLVEELSGVEDVEHFDMVWSAFYDWADWNRVWVKTF